MKNAAEDADRFDVRSADGTTIAVFVEGEGPALVMVHGSLQDHTATGVLMDAFRQELTTFSMDRRGFGASGDASEYSIEREFEDVAAVVDAAVDRSDGPVALWGHSYGASCAMGGAALSANVHHLVLYEPSLGLTYPVGSIDSIEHKVRTGDREGALLEVLVDIAGMTDDEVATMRENPYLTWEDRLATVPTLPRECRAEEGWVYHPGRFADVSARTLLLAGSQSPPALDECTQRAAEAIPDASIHTLEGHGHFAHRSDPVMVADVIRQFAWP